MLPTLGASNSKPSKYNKSTKWPKKGIISLVALSKWIMYLSKFLYRILFNQMHYMNIAKHKCMHYLFMREN
jgi:hypothetical protein